jgi:hypothetical protein
MRSILYALAFKKGCVYNIDPCAILQLKVNNKGELKIINIDDLDNNGIHLQKNT